ncbi:hypothetical protein HY772_05170 [Candidatus Woesearchaeota archaeon]|nr:hypothetical protein [Candidatus Woesearchaeota archaeon]
MFKQSVYRFSSQGGSGTIRDRANPMRQSINSLGDNRAVGTHAAVDIEAVCILRKYHSSIERERTTGGCFFNGCQNRATKLLDDLKDIGIDGFVIVVNSIDGLTHESGALFDFHHVVLTSCGRVFDPNYSGVLPRPLDEYISAAYSFPTNILLWKKGYTAKPIGHYDEAARRLCLESDFVTELSKRKRKMGKNARLKRSVEQNISSSLETRPLPRPVSITVFDYAP